MRIRITCRGCWRILALGVSTKGHREVCTNADGITQTIIERLLPAHDEEICPDCGAVYDCGPLDAWEEDGKLLSTHEGRERQGKRVQFEYRGPVVVPMSVEGKEHWLLPDVDDQREQWLPAGEDKLEEQWL